MANSFLVNALKSLSNNGAQNLPSDAEVEAAADKTVWKGPRNGGGQWELRKNSATSFDTSF